jgi:phosphoribosylformylglycinamidine synthase PurS subunit
MSALYLLDMPCPVLRLGTATAGTTNFHLSKSGCPSMVGTLMKVHVVVMPKQSVLDPQGVAVRNALKDVGLDTVDSVRVGKLLELEFKTPPDEAKLDEVCRDLLSNPVIEEYTIRCP